MPANQRERILEVNETTVEFRGDTSVVQVFTERAAQRPSAVALFGTERNYTWSELADQAARLAAWLAEGRDVRGQVVAVLADRNELSVVAFLGVAWAGAVYLPISAEFPTERIRAILADSGAVMAVSAGCDVPPDCAMTAWADIPLMNMTVSASVLRQPDDPLYVMYTSGSTGTPKGVVVSHRNVQRLVGPTSYVTWHENDRVALASTPAFDAMTFEMWGALLNGVPLACVPKSVLLEPDALERHLVHHAISVAFLSTAMFNYLAARRPQVFGRLRCVLFGGETATGHLVQEVRRANPELQLHHVYGPTENTTFSTCYAVRGGEKRLPIGRPIGNSKAWVVDHAFRPLPVGAIGQLVVGGAGVAMGYHGRPDLTAERFVQADLSGSGMLHRIYLTGDLARWTPDFQIDFLGRSDHQVKIQGYRVELEEIRALMLRCSGITEVEILPGVRTEEGFKSVYAYFCATRSISVSQLRAELAEVLPPYMVPSRLVQLASFPLTPQGKVDKAALDSIPVDSVATNARDSVDIRILAIWHELLQTNELSIDDHFSVVGGHSMLLLQLAHALYREFGVELSLSELIALPTVRSLADRLRPSQVGDEAFRLQPA
jgi:amino acid adenylation domain-containing protein